MLTVYFNTELVGNYCTWRAAVHGDHCKTGISRGWNRLRFYVDVECYVTITMDQGSPTRSIIHLIYRKLPSTLCLQTGRVEKIGSDDLPQIGSDDLPPTPPHPPNRPILSKISNAHNIMLCFTKVFSAKDQKEIAHENLQERKRKSWLRPELYRHHAGRVCFKARAPHLTQAQHPTNHQPRFLDPRRHHSEA